LNSALFNGENNVGYERSGYQEIYLMMRYKRACQQLGNFTFTWNFLMFHSAF